MAELEGNHAAWCATELAGLSDPQVYDPMRGTSMFLQLVATFTDKRRVGFARHELAAKQAVWEWFSTLGPTALEKAVTIHDKAWVDLLIKLAKMRHSKGPGIWVSSLDGDNIGSLPTKNPASVAESKRKNASEDLLYWKFRSSTSHESTLQLPPYRPFVHCLQVGHAFLEKVTDWGKRAAVGRDGEQHGPAAAAKDRAGSKKDAEGSSSEVSGTAKERQERDAENRRVVAYYNETVNSFASASQALEDAVRIADGAQKDDTLTLTPSAIADPAWLWKVLEKLSLGSFATSIPPKEVLDRSGAGVHASTAWFANTGVYSVGSYIANRLELALMREFRAWAESHGKHAALLSRGTGQGAVPSAGPGPAGVGAAAAVQSPTKAGASPAGKAAGARPATSTAASSSGSGSGVSVSAGSSAGSIGLVPPMPQWPGLLAEPDHGPGAGKDGGHAGTTARATSPEPRTAGAGASAPSPVSPGRSAVVAGALSGPASSPVGSGTVGGLPSSPGRAGASHSMRGSKSFDETHHAQPSSVSSSLRPHGRADAGPDGGVAGIKAGSGTGPASPGRVGQAWAKPAVAGHSGSSGSGSLPAGSTAGNAANSGQAGSGPGRPGKQSTAAEIAAAGSRSPAPGSPPSRIPGAAGHVGSGPASIASPSSGSGAGSGTQHGLSLVNKSHLALLWDGLNVKERQRILIGDGPGVGPDGRPLSGAGSEPSDGSPATGRGSVRRGGALAASSPSTQSTARAKPSPSSSVPGAPLPSSAASVASAPDLNVSSGSAASLGLDGDGAGRAGLEGAAGLQSWPYQLVQANGWDLVQEVYLRPLRDAGGPREQEMRDIGLRLQSSWAELQAQNLIRGETESKSRHRAGTGTGAGSSGSTGSSSARKATPVDSGLVAPPSPSLSGRAGGTARPSVVGQGGTAEAAAGPEPHTGAPLTTRSSVGMPSAASHDSGESALDSFVTAHSGGSHGSPAVHGRDGAAASGAEQGRPGAFDITGEAATAAGSSTAATKGQPGGKGRARGGTDGQAVAGAIAASTGTHSSSKSDAAVANAGEAGSHGAAGAAAAGDKGKPSPAAGSSYAAAATASKGGAAKVPGTPPRAAGAAAGGKSIGPGSPKGLGALGSGEKPHEDEGTWLEAAWSTSGGRREREKEKEKEVQAKERKGSSTGTPTKGEGQAGGGRKEKTGAPSTRTPEQARPEPAAFGSGGSTASGRAAQPGHGKVGSTATAAVTSGPSAAAPPSVPLSKGAFAAALDRAAPPAPAPAAAPVAHGTDKDHKEHKDKEHKDHKEKDAAPAPGAGSRRRTSIGSDGGHKATDPKAVEAKVAATAPAPAPAPAPAAAASTPAAPSPATTAAGSAATSAAGSAASKMSYAALVKGKQQAAAAQAAAHAAAAGHAGAASAGAAHATAAAGPKPGESTAAKHVAPPAVPTASASSTTAQPTTGHKQQSSSKGASSSAPASATASAASAAAGAAGPGSGANWGAFAKTLRGGPGPAGKGTGPSSAHTSPQLTTTVPESSGHRAGDAFGHADAAGSDGRPTVQVEGHSPTAAGHGAGPSGTSVSAGPSPALPSVPGGSVPVSPLLRPSTAGSGPLSAAGLAAAVAGASWGDAAIEGPTSPPLVIDGASAAAPHAHAAAGDHAGAAGVPATEAKAPPKAPQRSAGRSRNSSVWSDGPPGGISSKAAEAAGAGAGSPALTGAAAGAVQPAAGGKGKKTKGAVSAGATAGEASAVAETAPSAASATSTSGGTTAGGFRSAEGLKPSDGDGSSAFGRRGSVGGGSTGARTTGSSGRGGGSGRGPVPAPAAGAASGATTKSGEARRMSESQVTSSAKSMGSAASVGGSTSQRDRGFSAGDAHTQAAGPPPAPPPPPGSTTPGRKAGPPSQAGGQATQASGGGKRKGKGGGQHAHGPVSADAELGGFGYSSVHHSPRSGPGYSSGGAPGAHEAGHGHAHHGDRQRRDRGSGSFGALSVHSGAGTPLGPGLGHGGVPMPLPLNIGPGAMGAAGAGSSPGGMPGLNTNDPNAALALMAAQAAAQVAMGMGIVPPGHLNMPGQLGLGMGMDAAGQAAQQAFNQSPAHAQAQAAMQRMLQQAAAGGASGTGGAPLPLPVGLGGGPGGFNPAAAMATVNQLSMNMGGMPRPTSPRKAAQVAASMMAVALGLPGAAFHTQGMPGQGHGQGQGKGSAGLQTGQAPSGPASFIPLGVVPLPSTMGPQLGGNGHAAGGVVAPAGAAAGEASALDMSLAVSHSTGSSSDDSALLDTSNEEDGDDGARGRAGAPGSGSGSTGRPAAGVDAPALQLRQVQDTMPHLAHGQHGHVVGGIAMGRESPASLSGRGGRTPTGGGPSAWHGPGPHGERPPLPMAGRPPSRTSGLIHGTPEMTGPHPYGQSATSPSPSRGPVAGMGTPSGPGARSGHTSPGLGAATGGIVYGPPSGVVHMHGELGPASSGHIHSPSPVHRGFVPSPTHGHQPGYGGAWGREASAVIEPTSPSRGGVAMVASGASSAPGSAGRPGQGQGGRPVAPPAHAPPSVILVHRPPSAGGVPAGHQLVQLPEGVHTMGQVGQAIGGMPGQAPPSFMGPGPGQAGAMVMIPQGPQGGPGGSAGQGTMVPLNVTVTTGEGGVQVSSGGLPIRGMQGMSVQSLPPGVTVQNLHMPLMQNLPGGIPVSINVSIAPSPTGQGSAGLPHAVLQGVQGMGLTSLSTLPEGQVADPGHAGGQVVMGKPTGGPLHSGVSLSMPATPAHGMGLTPMSQPGLGQSPSAFMPQALGSMAGQGVQGMGMMGAPMGMAMGMGMGLGAFMRPPMMGQLGLVGPPGVARGGVGSPTGAGPQASKPQPGPGSPPGQVSWVMPYVPAALSNSPIVMNAITGRGPVPGWGYTTPPGSVTSPSPLPQHPSVLPVPSVLVETLRTSSPRRVTVEDLCTPDVATGTPVWLEYQLHAELIKLQAWCASHAQYRRMQELRTVWDVSRLVLDALPSTGAHVRVFGSFMTGLATPTSDVDVLISLGKGESGTPQGQGAAGAGKGGKAAGRGDLAGLDVAGGLPGDRFGRDGREIAGTGAIGGPGTLLNKAPPRQFHLLAQAIKNAVWATAVKEISTAQVPVIKLVRGGAQVPPWDEAPQVVHASALQNTGGNVNGGAGASSANNTTAAASGGSKSSSAGTAAGGAAAAGGGTAVEGTPGRKAKAAAAGQASAAPPAGLASLALSLASSGSAGAASASPVTPIEDKAAETASGGVQAAGAPGTSTAGKDGQAPAATSAISPTASSDDGEFRLDGGRAMQGTGQVTGAAAGGQGQAVQDKQKEKDTAADAGPGASKSGAAAGTTPGRPASNTTASSSSSSTGASGTPTKQSSGAGLGGAGPPNGLSSPGPAPSPRLMARRGSLESMLAATAGVGLRHPTFGSSGNGTPTNANANAAAAGAQGVAPASGSSGPTTGGTATSSTSAGTSNNSAAGGANGAASSTSASNSNGNSNPPELSNYARAGWFDRTAPIRLDITFDSSTHRGDKTTGYSREQLASLPMLGPLILAVKVLLAGHGLNDAFTGGLSSFGMLLLTQVYIQHALSEETGYTMNWRPHPQASQAMSANGSTGAPPFALQPTLATPFYRDVVGRPRWKELVNIPETPLQPGSDGRSFHAVAEPFARLPRELVGPGLAAVTESGLPLPVPMRTSLPTGVKAPYSTGQAGQGGSGNGGAGQGGAADVTAGGSGQPGQSKKNKKKAGAGAAGPAGLVVAGTPSLTATGGPGASPGLAPLSPGPAGMAAPGTVAGSGVWQAPAGLRPTITVRQTSTSARSGSEGSGTPSGPVAAAAPLASPSGSTGTAGSAAGTAHGSVAAEAHHTDGHAVGGAASPTPAATAGAPASDGHKPAQAASSGPEPSASSAGAPVQAQPAADGASGRTTPIPSAGAPGAGQGSSRIPSSPVPASGTASHAGSVPAAPAGHLHGGRSAGGGATPAGPAHIHGPGMPEEASLLAAPCLGRYFMRLLHFYGDVFTSPTTTLIDPLRGAIMPMMMNSSTGGYTASGITDPLNIPDPLNPAQNVGRNCFRFFQVQAVFRDARRALLGYAAANKPSRERLQALADAVTKEAVATGWLPPYVLNGPSDGSGLQAGSPVPSTPSGPVPAAHPAQQGAGAEAGRNEEGQEGPRKSSGAHGAEDKTKTAGDGGAPAPADGGHAAHAAGQPAPVTGAQADGAAGDGQEPPEFPLLSLIIAAVRGL